tara:strand:- start:67 stop:243 length:177 start_codon:yes stop_codon:yes gene_type:complete
MDPDIDIVKRQIAEEVKEKYKLYKRIEELNKEISNLKDRLMKIEKPHGVLANNPWMEK